MPNKIHETLNEVKRLNFKEEGRFFIFFLFFAVAPLSVGRLQSKKETDFFFTSLLLEFALAKSSQTISVRCTVLVKDNRAQGLHKAR